MEAKIQEGCGRNLAEAVLLNERLHKKLLKAGTAPGDKTMAAENWWLKLRIS
jgi:hypothetical protein